jgi:magnesium-transporting ATPase (P-type)
VLEFNSTRKRMSVIVRNEQGQLLLYTKGADNVIYERFHKQLNPYAENTKLNLKHFAIAGLRTLVCAKAFLDENEYIKWKEIYREATTNVDDKEKMVMAAAELIEKDLILVGTTAIEDKLQDGVPNTISELAKANIKIFVLTGDKQETAINIGYACSLLNNEMARIVLNKENRKELKLEIRKQLELAVKGQIFGQENGLGLIIDGGSLEYVLPSNIADEEVETPDKQRLIDDDEDDPREESLSITFLKLCMLCKSVICCRVSPLQKSLVVKLVKDNYPTAITLAIGDGANDVSMIQAAHIGIGIAGQEGLQAARASDYAIGQFRFLKPLLLVHGRWSYRRIGKLICYSFYKNITLQLTQLWYVFFNGFTGLSLYDSISLMLFNVAFTSLPIIAFAIFDRDVPKEVCMKFPELYVAGQKDYYFNLRIFSIWILNAILHSACCFFIPFIAYHFGLLNAGKTPSHETLGVTVYTCVILVVTLKVGLESYSWTAFHHLIIWGSILAWFVYQTVYSLLWELVPAWRFWPVTTVDDSTRDIYFSFYIAAQNSAFWFILILTIVVALLRDVVWECISRNIVYTRQLFHALQEIDTNKVQYEDLDKYYDLNRLNPPQEKIQIGKYITGMFVTIVHN